MAKSTIANAVDWYCCETIADGIGWIIEHNGEPYTPAKPIASALGINWAAQVAKIKQRFESTVSMISTVAEDGKAREMLCLPLRKLPAYLYSIDPRKVKPEIRAKVEIYQHECDEVLWRHWICLHSQQTNTPIQTQTPHIPSSTQQQLNDLLQENQALKAELLDLLRFKVNALERNPQPSSTQLSPQETDTIKRLSNQGWSHTKIARQIGRAQSTVSRILRGRVQ